MKIGTRAIVDTLPKVHACSCSGIGDSHKENCLDKHGTWLDETNSSKYPEGIFVFDNLHCGFFEACIQLREENLKAECKLGRNKI